MFQICFRANHSQDQVFKISKIKTASLTPIQHTVGMGANKRRRQIVSTILLIIAPPDFQTFHRYREAKVTSAINYQNTPQ